MARSRYRSRRKRRRRERENRDAYYSYDAVRGRSAEWHGGKRRSAWTHVEEGDVTYDAKSRRYRDKFTEGEVRLWGGRGTEFARMDVGKLDRSKRKHVQREGDAIRRRARRRVAVAASTSKTSFGVGGAQGIVDSLGLPGQYARNKGAARKRGYRYALGNRKSRR